jgi:hypothetical protein
MVDFYSDFLINMDLGFDRAIRCHSNLDAAISIQGDLILVDSAKLAVLQKLFIWLGIRPGEVPGEPNLGCPIYKYFYRKAIPNTFSLQQREIEYQLKTYIPELDVQAVKTIGLNDNGGRVDGVQISVTSLTYGKFDLTTNQADLETYNEYLNNVWSPIANFSYPDNSQLQDLVF